MFQTLPHFSSHLTSMIAQVGAIIAPPRHPTQWTKTLNEDSAKRSGTNTSKFPGWHGNLMEFGHLTLLTLDIYTILTKLHKSQYCHQSVLKNSKTLNKNVTIFRSFSEVEFLTEICCAQVRLKRRSPSHYVVLRESVAHPTLHLEFNGSGWDPQGLN